MQGLSLLIMLNTGWTEAIVTKARRWSRRLLQQSMGPWTGGVAVTLTGRHSPLPRRDRFETEEWTRLGKWPQLLDKQKIHSDPEILTLSELGVNRVIYRKEKAGKGHVLMDILWMSFQTSSPTVNTRQALDTQGRMGLQLVSVAPLYFYNHLDESERGEWKSWLKAQHSEN